MLKSICLAAVLGGVALGGAASAQNLVNQPRSTAEAEALQIGQQILVRRPPREIAMPHGYRHAWDDDRLNPYRGKQTLNGALQTALYWTQTVPRRLKSASGRDVTTLHNYLIFPYTDYHKQRSDLQSGAYITVRSSRGQRQIIHRDRLR